MYKIYGLLSIFRRELNGCVKLANVFKTYPGGVTAVSDFTIDIEDKEFCLILLRLRKTTTLRMIAGLEEITEGGAVHRTS